jgi:NAD(P)-dependent dehydrogenase (short-subunit alcohol dehydrogenase family)
MAYCRRIAKKGPLESKVEEVIMAGRLIGKVAIVTGAGSSGQGVGNGKAAAIVFAREGAKVLCVDLVPDRAGETVAAIEREGGIASAFPADVTQKVGCEAMVAAAVERYGRLDILQNNVGVSAPRHAIQQVTEEDFDRLMAVNVKSMLLSIQAAIPAMDTAGGGSIINISSIAGLRYHGAYLTTYTTTKAAVIGLTLTAAGQLGARRIRVNCIAPGNVFTPMVASIVTPETRERRRLAGLITDEGTAWDIAWAAVFLASDESRWITGQVLSVDAGLSITTRNQEITISPR